MMFCLSLICGVLSCTKTAAKRSQSPRGDGHSNIQQGVANAKQQEAKSPNLEKSAASGDTTSEPKRYREKPWWLGASSWKPEGKCGKKPPKKSGSNKNKKQKVPKGVILVEPYSPDQLPPPPPPPPPNNPVPTHQPPRPATRPGVAKGQALPWTVAHPEGAVLVKPYSPDRLSQPARNSSVPTDWPKRPVTRRGFAKGKALPTAEHHKGPILAKPNSHYQLPPNPRLSVPTYWPKRPVARHGRPKGHTKPANLMKTHHLPPLALTSTDRERLVTTGFMNPKQEVTIIERPGGLAFDINFSDTLQARPSTAKRLEQRKKRKSKKQLEEKIKIAVQKKTERLQAIQEKMRDLSSRRRNDRNVNQVEEMDNSSDEFWFPDQC